MNYIDFTYIIDRVESKISEWWVRSDHGNRKEDCVHFVMDEIMKETKGFVNPQILEYYTKLAVDNFMG